jgi:hypothetical protein
MDREHEYLLDVISNINTNDKLCTQGDMMDVYRPTVLRGVMRWWSGETRLRNVQTVELVIKSVMAQLRVQSGERETDRSGRMAVRLAASMRGILNLIETYRDDVVTCSRLRVLHSEIVSYLSTRGDQTQVVVYRGSTDVPRY